MEEVFGFFELEPSFWPDEAELKAVFLKNAKKWHPDLAGNDIQAIERAMQMSSKNNEYFAKIKQFNARLELILNHWGMAGEDEKNALSQEFLAEMMELNDQIMDAVFEGEKKAKEANELLEKHLEENEEILKKLTKEYDRTKSVELKPLIRNEYQKMKYLQRLQKNRKK